MDEFEELKTRLEHDLNCLAEKDRNVKKNALARIRKTLLPDNKLRHKYFVDVLQKPLFRLFADAVEKIRVLSVELASELFEELPDDDVDNVLPLLLAGLLGRVRVVPFPEPSEELRLQILEILMDIMNKCGKKINAYSHDVLDALAKSFTDTCPDVKKQCALVVRKSIDCIEPDRFSKPTIAKPLVTSVIANLRHQHWKVRRALLESIGSLLLDYRMWSHFDDVIPALSILSADRTPQVRRAAINQIENFLKIMRTTETPDEPISFEDDPKPPVGPKKYEARLLYLMYSFTADPEEDIGREALEALGRACEVVEPIIATEEKADKEAQKAAYPGAQKEVPDCKIECSVDYSNVRLPSPFKEGDTPNPAVCAVTARHLQALLRYALGDLAQWTSAQRVTSGKLLRVLITFANKNISSFCEAILVNLYRAAADDEPDVIKFTGDASELFGAFVEPSFWLPLSVGHLGLCVSEEEQKKIKMKQEEDALKLGAVVTRTLNSDVFGNIAFVASTVENRRQVLFVLARALRGGALDETDVNFALSCLEEAATHEQLVDQVIVVCQSTLLRANPTMWAENWPRAFRLILRCRSFASDTTAADDCVEVLASHSGLGSSLEMYRRHVHDEFNNLDSSGATQTIWEESAPDRHVLDVLVRKSGEAIGDHLDDLVKVLKLQACPDRAGIAARMDLLGVVHFLCHAEHLDEFVKLVGENLIEDVLVPNATWQAGQANSKIRKGAMVCINSLLNKKLISPEELQECLGSLMPVIKSSLDDNWSPDNRLAGIYVVTEILKNLHGCVTGDELREIYPELLKRLDDSNDTIRQEVCKTFIVFFGALPARWSTSLYEYILRNLFIHLDDPNPAMQEAVQQVLESAMHYEPSTFITEAKTAGTKSVHPRQCEELLKIAETLSAAGS